MQLFHEKTDGILQKTVALRQGWAHHSPAPEMIYSCRPERDEPAEGQFDDEDLSREVYDPLETPTITPVQDEENVMTTSTATKGDQSTASSQETAVEMLHPLRVNADSLPSLAPAIDKRK